MLNEISGKILSNLPNETPYLFYGAAAIVGGRKWVQAAGCKAWAVVAEKLGKTNSAEWNQSSKDYWTMAKKDAVYDLTLASGFALTGFALGQTKTAFELLNNTPQVNDLQKQIHNLTKTVEICINSQEEEIISSNRALSEKLINESVEFTHKLIEETTTCYQRKIYSTGILTFIVSFNFGIFFQTCMGNRRP